MEDMAMKGRTGQENMLKDTKDKENHQNAALDTRGKEWTEWT